MRDIGAAGMADVLMRAAESVTATSEEWAARRDEINRQPEYSVLRPYIGLSNADQLVGLTNEYWAAAEEKGWWGDKLDAFLCRAVEAEARAGDRSRPRQSRPRVVRWWRSCKASPEATTSSISRSRHRLRGSKVGREIQLVQGPQQIQDLFELTGTQDKFDWVPAPS